MKFLSLFLCLFLLPGCFDNNDTQAKSKDSIQLGKTTFDKNCIVCHGKGAKGLTSNWKKSVSGAYPAPPLNGSAHSWHHSRATLLASINEGGIKLGGTMPGFKNKLTDDEKKALLDYMYSLWPKTIQQKYDARFK